MNPLSAGLKTIASGARPAGPITPTPTIAKKPWEIIHSNVPPTGVTREIPRSVIVPDPDQPRKDFNEEKMQELIESMRQDGQLVELVVFAPFTLGEPFVISMGERRWRASEFVPLETLRCRVMPQPKDKVQQLILALIDGLHRADLTPIDAARSYRRLEASGMSQSAIATRLAIPRPRVNEMCRVMDLGEEVLEQARREAWTAQRLIQMARATPEERQEMREAAQQGGGLTGGKAAQIRARSRAVAGKSPKKGKAQQAAAKVAGGSEATGAPSNETPTPWTFSGKGGAVVTVSGARNEAEIAESLRAALASVA